MEVELFECERYRPLAGWSQDFLLPTDLCAYRLRGCKSSWGTLDDAEAALLAPGWDWQEAWSRAEWLYAPNFRPDFEGSKGLQLVRWRRLARRQGFSFGASLVCIALAQHAEQMPVRMVQAGRWRAVDVDVATCTNADGDLQQSVGRSLMEACAQASSGDLDFLALVQLKISLAEHLNSDRSGTLAECLREFASRRSWARWRAETEPPAERLASVEAGFLASERDAYALVAMRRFCTDRTCREEGSHECRFAMVPCPYDGCAHRCSSCALPTHEELCPYRLVSCECSELVPRRQLEKHRAVCPLREVSCSFEAVGCPVRLAACELPAHERTRHVHLLLEALLQQKRLNRSYAERVGELEGVLNDDHRSELGALASRAARLEARLQTFESKMHQDAKRLVEDASGEMRKKAGVAGSEAKRLNEAALRGLRQEVNSIKVQIVEHSKVAPVAN